MEKNFSPKRITDLIELKKEGAKIECNASFEVIPVDFVQRNSPYRAHIFLCGYSGTIDGKEFSFRKCYARGCPKNLCPHVSQAVMIANRYLQRDYKRLKEGGIEIEEGKLFSLDDMVVKFDDYNEEYSPTLTIEDYINIAKEGSKVSVDIELEYLPAVEHFANYKNSQTFLNGTFNVESLGKVHPVQRCLACYPTEEEKTEKEKAVNIANDRLTLLYKRFDDAGIKYEKKLFQ